jgi:hypothetical protein
VNVGPVRESMAIVRIDDSLDDGRMGAGSIVTGDGAAGGFGECDHGVILAAIDPDAAGVHQDGIPGPPPSHLYTFVMTESARAHEGGGAVIHCRWCRRVVTRTPGPGRPRQFCSQRCRQWDWVSRQRAADLALGVNEIVVRRDELDRLHDDLYMLACAIDDVERDLGTRPSTRELADALDWLLHAAKPLQNREISAPGTPPVKTS